MHTTTGPRTTYPALFTMRFTKADWDALDTVVRTTIEREKAESGRSYLWPAVTATSILKGWIRSHAVIAKSAAAADTRITRKAPRATKPRSTTSTKVARRVRAAAKAARRHVAKHSARALKKLGKPARKARAAKRPTKRVPKKQARRGR